MSGAGTQARELKRVTSKIGRAVLEFIEGQPLGVEWSASDLGGYVSDRCACAPASADRVMRDLRKRGLVHVLNTDRARSLYARVEPEPVEQMEMWG